MTTLQNIPTKAPDGFNKAQTQAETEQLKKRLDELQNLLYAEGKWSVLAIVQGMDASGKDGAIKNVFSGLNPQGIRVQSFKAPTEEELSHDFLWRIHHHVPPKGMIQVFNRSHYEDVLVTRVHGWCDDETAKKRFKAINHFEELLEKHNNTKILKFYMHISPEEQQERLKERVENPKKAWKYNARDFEEAKLWDQYMKMYDEVFTNCNDPEWIIVPADKNWYKEYIITKALTDTLASLNMQFPGMKE